MASVLKDLRSLNRKLNKISSLQGIRLSPSIADANIQAIKAVCPVDTGRLRDGFRAEQEGNDVKIVNDVEYYPYVEGRLHFVEKTFNPQQIFDEVERQVKGELQ